MQSERIYVNQGKAVCTIKRRNQPMGKGTGNYTQKKIRKPSGHLREGVIAFGACAALALGVFSTTSMGYQITIDGQVAGASRSTEAFTESLGRIDEIVQTTYGMDNARVADTISVQRCVMTGSTESSQADYTHALLGRDHDVSIDGVTMIVDGRTVGDFVSKQQAEEALQAAVAKSGNVGNSDTVLDYRINSNITYKNTTFDVSEVKTNKEWANVLTESNDSANGKAVVASTGQTVTVPEKAVPASSVNSETSEQPTAASTNAQDSLLKIDLTKESTINTAIPYSVVTQEDPSAYAGIVTVSQPGQSGVRTTQLQVSYQNGQEVSSQVLSESITKEPVPQIVLIGTNTFPTQASKKGDFILPAKGDVTSTDKSGSHAGYKAIDIAAAQGSPIYAPKDGTVIMAQEYSSYGNTVQIQADDGTIFLMAHNSEFKCSVGDKVKKGQVVALMGSTGNSTGPHCHFEIRINGEQQVITDYFDLGLGDVV
jgi:murein DD-endopeptidase MepM/ murein hydrolase activator NlpD